MAANPIEYRFERYRLLPATRELWKDGAMCRAQPLVFDGLVYLLEHRQRVVGRDELASAVWARADIGDQQVRQLVLRVRQLVGDDAKTQRVIRTASGGGYHWVMPVEEATVCGHPAVPPPAVGDTPIEAQPRSSTSLEHVAAPAKRAFVSRSRKMVFLAVAALIAVVTIWTRLTALESTSRLPSSAETGGATVMLPLEVVAPEGAGWVRLGAMDLIAQRMRSAGMPVAPSDSVVSAVHAIGEADQPERIVKLQEVLGAAALVHGSATQSTAGWNVQLSTTDRSGLHHRVEATRADVTEASRHAADLLAAALGYSTPIDSGQLPGDLEESLQRTQAALLANQLDAARAALAHIPESQQAVPLVRAKTAQVEFRAGRLDRARELLIELLADPAAKAQPIVYAQALTTLGFIETHLDDFASAERYFNRATAMLTDRTTTREFGTALAARGLARAGLRQYEEAAHDLAQAGPLLQAAGDRLGVARVDNYLGQLEMARERPASAVGHFRAAVEIYESSGGVEGLRANLFSLCDAHMRLLQWPEASSACDRLWNLRERLHSPVEILSAVFLRARMLLATGRLREAAQMLNDAEPVSSEAPQRSRQFFFSAKAEWSWQSGRFAEALASTQEALELLPLTVVDSDHALLVLLCQRASIALSSSCPRSAAILDGIENTQAVDLVSYPSVLIAIAERLAQAGSTSAGPAFERAVSVAEARGVPDDLARAASAYALWLLQHGRREEARTSMGRVLPWARHDFDIALLQLEVFHEFGQREPWAEALEQAQKLARERPIPANLMRLPSTLEQPGE